MKALLALFHRAPKVHNDLLRANQFDKGRTFSPYVAMLPGAQG
jgi:hypothetical protein